MKQCSIIVFGDIGRSPRMVNHALAISENMDYKINLFAYLDNKPSQTLLQNPNIKLIDLNSRLVNLSKRLPSIFYLFYAIFRIVYQSIFLFCSLMFRRKQEFILVQNPPSIPVLHIVWLIKLFRKSRIIIDFHNYGHTILALSVRNKLILKLSLGYERLFARKFDIALCVSEAMQRDLLLNWKIKAIVLYDKANITYYPINQMQEKHLFFQKLDFQWNIDNEYESDSKIYNPYTKYNRYSENETLFTMIDKGQTIFKEDKPALLISSTSWTKDEDFSILKRALDQYDEMVQMVDEKYQSLFVVITGKGPQRDEYLQIFSENNLKWKFVRVYLSWLESEDYPKLLGLADLGICLHYSSSGLDLPMKVVDMFSVGTPVFAKKFQAIGELVQHQKNGIVFDSSDDLFDYLSQAFKQNSKLLFDFRKGVEEFKQITFDQEWRQKLLSKLIKTN